MIKLGSIRLLRDTASPHMVRIEDPASATEKISFRCLIGVLIAMGDGWTNYDPMTGYVESPTGVKMAAADFVPEELSFGLYGTCT